MPTFVPWLLMVSPGCERSKGALGMARKKR